MRYNVRDIIEYVIALVDEFSKRFGLSEKQAYSYINAHKGIAFIEQHYGIMHTLDFNEAVETLLFIAERQEGCYDSVSRFQYCHWADRFREVQAQQGFWQRASYQTP